jgi:serine/threonine protein kinase
MDVDEPHRSVPAPLASSVRSTAVGGAGAHTASVIPPFSYTMPGPASWRVKPQFASFEVDHNRFEIKRALGKGSYGVVVEAIDHLTGKRVAIKKINSVFDVFENAKRIFREVRILADLKHANIVQLVHICQPPDLLKFTDLYVVFECMDTDLAKLCKDDTQCLTVPHVRCVARGAQRAMRPRRAA